MLKDEQSTPFSIYHRDLAVTAHCYSFAARTLLSKNPSYLSIKNILARRRLTCSLQASKASFLSFACDSTRAE